LRDALVLIDLISRFDHEDADRLLASLRQRLPNLLAALERARSHRVPVIYVNDSPGTWSSDAPGLVRSAIRDGRARKELERLAPRAGDLFVLKPRYSGFDHTPLVLVLREMGIERIVVAGAATERCVVQTAIDARELGFKVSVLEDACATIDPEIEQLALVYAERIAGAFVISQEAWNPAD